MKILIENGYSFLTYRCDYAYVTIDPPGRPSFRIPTYISTVYLRMGRIAARAIYYFPLPMVRQKPRISGIMSMNAGLNTIRW